RIAADGGRLYQVMRVAPGRDTPPDWWPGGFFLLGPKAIGEPHFNKLADLLLRQYREHEKSARGTRAWRALSEKVLALETIVGHNAKER
ncbi:MAG: hypothetical protein LBS18_02125, partial [Clostridiales bacterium]|nr:hypothetical protein [Clostridiales bacterium]